MIAGIRTGRGSIRRAIALVWERSTRWMRHRQGRAYTKPRHQESNLVPVPWNYSPTTTELGNGCTIAVAAITAGRCRFHPGGVLEVWP